MAAIELVDSDKVLEVVKFHGPLQPLDVRKVIGRGDSIVIGAELSSLASRGHVKVTTVKRGGSPFYYVPGTESKLERVAEFLNEKDIRAYNFLKEKKILRDKSQEPLTRVSLRSIKDYSKQLVVKVNGENEIFWRYFLISENDAIAAIKNAFKPKTETKPSPTPVQAPKPTEKKPVIQESQKSIVDVEHSQQTNELFEQSEDKFLKSIQKFFDEKGIRVKEAKLIRKGSDYEFIIEMQTSVGPAEYYCKAKGKKKCSDGDLSTAYLQGQTRRIPVVFITTGEVAKKAKEKTKTDYKGMLIKEI